jgi:class 3 adenylate cyclase
MKRYWLDDCSFLVQCRSGVTFSMLIAIVLLSGLYSSELSATDKLPVVELSREMVEPLSVRDQIGVMPMQYDAQISLEDIVQMADSAFYLRSEIGKIPPHYNAWLKFSIVNLSDEPLNHYLLGGMDQVEIDFYTLYGDSLVQSGRGGRTVPPANRLIPALQNIFFLHLDAGEKKHYFIKSRLLEDAAPDPYFQYSVRSGIFNYLRDSSFRNTFQTFLAGIMITIAAVGMVMFFSFRERLFAFFTFLMASFTVYFANINGVLHFFVTLPQDFIYIYTTSWSLAGAAIFSCLFAITYINLKSRSKILYFLFLGLAILTSLVLVLQHFVIENRTHGYFLANATGVVYLLTMFGVFLYYYLKKVKEAGVLLLSTILLLLGGIAFGLSTLNELPRNQFFLNGFQIGTIAFSGNLLFGLFDRITTIQREKLSYKIEREKSDELLFNVLPAEVAMELREKGRFEAREFDQISVLFTDFKDFTATASKMSARDLVSEINDCFMAFDQLAEKHGVEKIKTIGDSYMAAAGLGGDNQRESAEKLVRMALDMQRFMQNRKEELLRSGRASFEMRAGIHTGPVVAGIVGEKKFQYDIWGDTVNTASRMESKGEVGRVNISEQTYKLVVDCPDFTFEKREGVEVKGKGVLEMWFVGLASGL